MKHLFLPSIVILSLMTIVTECNKDEEHTREGGETGIVIDFDSNAYKTIKIGSQWWMAENLKTIHYANGTAIPLVESSSGWSDLEITDRAYCYYENSLDNGNTYGALYSWSAAMNGQRSSYINPSEVQGVCPSGWHLPSDKEWKQLEIYLGMSQSEADNTGWRGTNEGSKLAGNANLWDNDILENDPLFGTSGFSALPGGGRFPEGKFTRLNYAGFWSATKTDSLYAGFRELGYYNPHVQVEKRNGVRRNGYGYKTGGSSVRCIKD